MTKHKKNDMEEVKETEEFLEEADDSAEKAENPEAQNVAEILEQNQKLKEDVLRALADAENAKKRCQQEIEKNNKYAIASFAKELLGVADNLQRAIEAAGKEQENESCGNLLKGIELTQNELTKVFDKFHVHKMDVLGTVFDPNFHQVIQEVPDKTKPAGTIIAEVQTGYMIQDRILREAMVVVTKACD